MLEQRRWDKEYELMQRVFPQFEPFDVPESFRFGFQGYLVGRSGRRYEVVMEAWAETYPQYPPSVYVSPRVGGNWLNNGALCIEQGQWKPATSSFANLLLRTREYLEYYG